MDDENTLSAQVKRIDELKAAAGFLRWCRDNDKNCELAEEWVLALVDSL